MSTDQLLNEIERQQKYLDALPEDFPFPLFNTKRAVESQRQNGYRHTAAAAREIVDNAFEAGATKVHIITDERQNNTRKVVSSVAFIDNGSAMLPRMARFALSRGGGTHFDDATFIGKFGFGLPNGCSPVSILKKVNPPTIVRLPHHTYRRIDLCGNPKIGGTRAPIPRVLIIAE